MHFMLVSFLCSESMTVGIKSQIPNLVKLIKSCKGSSGAMSDLYTKYLINTLGQDFMFDPDGLLMIFPLSLS